MSHTDMTREQLLARLRELEQENAELRFQLRLPLSVPERDMWTFMYPCWKPCTKSV